MIQLPLKRFRTARSLPVSCDLMAPGSESSQAKILLLIFLVIQHCTISGTENGTESCHRVES